MGKAEKESGRVWINCMRFKRCYDRWKKETKMTDETVREESREKNLQIYDTIHHWIQHAGDKPGDLCRIRQVKLESVKKIADYLQCPAKEFLADGPGLDVQMKKAWEALGWQDQKNYRGQRALLRGNGGDKEERDWILHNYQQVLESLNLEEPSFSRLEMKQILKLLDQLWASSFYDEKTVGEGIGTSVFYVSPEYGRCRVWLPLSYELCRELGISYPQSYDIHTVQKEKSQAWKNELQTGIVGEAAAVKRENPEFSKAFGRMIAEYVETWEFVENPYAGFAPRSEAQSPWFDELLRKMCCNAEQAQADRVLKDAAFAREMFLKYGITPPF